MTIKRKLRKETDPFEQSIVAVQTDARTQLASRSAAALVTQAKDMVIVNDADQIRAVDLAGKVKSAQKDLKSVVDFFVTPLRAQVSRLERFFSEPKTKLANAEKIVKDKLVEYQMQKEEAERKRLEQINRRDIRAADKQGQEQGLLYREEIRQVAREEMGKTVAGETGVSITMTERPTVELVDITQVPAKFLFLNEPLALAEWRSEMNSPAFSIPGLKFSMKKVPSVRGAV